MYHIVTVSKMLLINVLFISMCKICLIDLEKKLLILKDDQTRLRHCSFGTTECIFEQPVHVHTLSHFNNLSVRN